MPICLHHLIVIWLFSQRCAPNEARHTSGLERTDETYFHLDSISDTFHYGYEVSPDGNFHHERRDDQGVTYGCYGYLDSNRKLLVTHYVADRRGYRVIEPNKPIYVYLSDKIAWQAFLFPRGCGKPSSSGPELIYKPLGSTSNNTKPTTSTTRRTTTIKPSTAQPASSTPATCSCKWPTVLTPKPPTATTARPKTASRTSTGTTTNSKKPEPDFGITIENASHYVPSPNFKNPFPQRKVRSQFPASPLIYYVPYQHSAAPPGIPTSSNRTCGSGFGYIGLAPVFFVPIGMARNLGLERNFAKSEANRIPFLVFTKPILGGNWTATEIPPDQGHTFDISYSKDLEKVVNSIDINALKQLDLFK